MNSNAELGRIIKERRHKKRLTIEKMSALSGVPQRTICGIESGENKSPAFSKICRITDVLEMSLDELRGMLPVETT